MARWALRQKSDLAQVRNVPFVLLRVISWIVLVSRPNRNDPQNHTNYTKLITTFNRLLRQCLAGESYRTQSNVAAINISRLWRECLATVFLSPLLLLAVACVRTYSRPGREWPKGFESMGGTEQC
jgi:hypothetical protein